MKSIVSGSIKYFKTHDIYSVTVPNLPEFKASKYALRYKADPIVAQYIMEISEY